MMRPNSERKDRDAVRKKESADLRAKSMAEPGVVFGLDEHGEIYLKRSSLERAIEHIVSESQDFTFLSMFFITHRSFASPHLLLSLLVKRFESSAGANAQQNRIRICIVLKHWISNQWEDFDDHMVKATRDFLRGTVTHLIPSSANILLQLLEKKLSGTETLPSDRPHPASLTLELWNPRAITSVSPLEIARQLTMIEQEIFLALRPHEFLSQGWLKADKEVSSPNIVAAVKWFNRLSYWWATEVLTQPGTPQRVAYCEWLIRLAQEFFQLQNYSCVLQILSALQSTPIRRLTDIWESMSPKSKKNFDQLTSQLSPTQGWQQQREMLSNKSPPSIPYIGMYLTDLTFLDDSALTIDKDLINFEKLRKVAAVIQEIQLYQAARHSFETLDFVRQYFFSVEPLDEPGRYERSYALLPRGARATVTQTDVSKPLEASTSAKMSGDVEALKGALLDAVTSADLCASIQEAYVAFQRTSQQLLRSKGSTSASFMDQSKSVHDSVSKVTVEILEFGSFTYVALWRMVVHRSGIAHAKKLASFYGMQTGHSSVRALILYAVLETEDLADFAREQDVVLIQLAPRPGTSLAAKPGSGADTASPRARQASSPPPRAVGPVASLYASGVMALNRSVGSVASSPPTPSVVVASSATLSLVSSAPSIPAASITTSPPPQRPVHPPAPPASAEAVAQFTSAPRTWLEFFTMGGFAKDLSEQYAALFQEHAIDMEQIADLNAQVLRDMGLRVGPIMRIMRAVNTFAESKKKTAP